MNNLYFIIITFLFSCSYGQIAVPASTWRFEPRPPRAPIDKKYEIQLTTVRNTAADDGKAVTWSMTRNAAQVCKFKQTDNSLVVTTTEENPIFTCTHEGFHRIIFDMAGEYTVTRDLRVKSTPFCFQWFAQILYSHVYKDPRDGDRIESQDLIGVWVVDYIGGGTRHMSSEELDGSAKEPSADSKQRSEEFKILENDPSMTVIQTEAEKPVYPMGFNETEKMWYFVVESESYTLFKTTVRVQDKGHVSRLDCFINPLDFILDHGDIFKAYSTKAYEPKYLTKLQELGYAQYPAYTIPAAEYDSQNKVPVGLANYPSGDEITLEWQGDDTIIKDACSPNLALYLHNTDSAIYFTRDGFQTSQELFTVPNIDGSGAGTHTVLGAAFTAGHLVVLASDSGPPVKTWLHVINKLTSDYKYIEIPTGINKIRGRDWCIGNYVGYLISDNEYVLLWNSNVDEEDILLVSTDGTVTSIDVPLEAELGRVAGETRQTLDAAFNIYPSTFGILMQLTVGARPVNNGLFVFVHNFERNEWEVFEVSATNGGPQVLYDQANGPYILQFQETGDIGFLILLKAAKEIYTFYKGSLGSGSKSFTTDEVPADDTIKDFVVSTNGDLVLMMTPGYQIYYSKIFLDQYRNVPKIVDTAENYLPWFDGLGQLYFIKDDRSRLFYHLKTEIVSQSWPNSFCEFRKFIHNITHPIYYFDKKETINFHVALAYRPYYPITLQREQGVAVSLQNNTVGLNMNSVSSSKDHYAEQWVTSIEDITITHDKDFLEIPNYAVENAKQSLVGLEIRPKLASVTCPSAIVTSYMVVGCLGNRKVIRVSVPTECTMPTSFSIPGERYSPHNGTNQGDLVVPYDPLWGCPIRHKASDAFKPTVQLLQRKVDVAETTPFDPQNFIVLDDNVPVNFVMFEKFGRIDIKYTASMLENKCLRLAQTFGGMFADAPEGTDVDAVWTPENYKSCFTDDGSNPSLDALSQKYEVLNNSQANGILFPSDINGIYVFRLRIIDPNYSFCNLVTEFAVEIYGAVEAVDYNNMAYVLICFLIVIVGLLVMSYIYFSVVIYPKIREEYES